METFEAVSWLSDAVIYEIYPQSFCDSNGDGIGDFKGAISRLDYVASLGINTIWLHPCFTSPFNDAGYDVADYYTVAPRYGTNADLIEFMAAAKERGIRVLLDLVVGHTSTAHAWFQHELASDSSISNTADRYIWADADQSGLADVGVLGSAAWVQSPGPRRGYYLKNFFDTQPALNFGYATLRDDEPWRQPVDAPGPLHNRAELRQIMSYWLDRGASGFRVDMAFSLVKDDPDLAATMALWRELRSWLAKSYPDAVLIPEGVEPASQSASAFDADFFLAISDEHLSLFSNGAAGRLPDQQPGPCYFDSAGQGSLDVFREGWEGLRGRQPDRLVLMGTSDHDFARLACGERSGVHQLGPAFAFLLTWGSVPVIYYGDEIGLPYQPNLPNVEGSVCFPGLYNRAGARTPMHWAAGVNAGFSSADPERLYLPIDPDPGRVTVAEQEADPDSLLSLVRQLLSIRAAHPGLGTGADTIVLHSGYPLVYSRGGEYLVVVNPSGQTRSVSVAASATTTGSWADGCELEPVFVRGVTVSGRHVHTAPYGFGIFSISDLAH